MQQRRMNSLRESGSVVRCDVVKYLYKGAICNRDMGELLYMRVGAPLVRWQAAVGQGRKYSAERRVDR